MAAPPNQFDASAPTIKLEKFEDDMLPQYHQREGNVKMSAPNDVIFDCSGIQLSDTEMNDVPVVAASRSIHRTASGSAGNSCCRRTRTFFLFACALFFMSWGILWLMDELRPPTYLSSREPTPWNTHGRGHLTLKIDNALEEKWNSYFEESTKEWDNDHGSSSVPDAITLITRNTTYDYECSPVRGRVKMCNGDYGNTDWVGICMSLISSSGYKIDSIVKLNDYHLDDGIISINKNAQRRYTMCHEVGHALGLPHTDENHYNINSGNCMDYTTRYQSNLKPGDVNFRLLDELYGSINKPQQGGGGLVNDDNLRRRTTSSYFNESVESESGSGSESSDEEDDSSDDEEEDDDVVVPDDVNWEYKQVVNGIQNSTTCTYINKEKKKRQGRKNDDEQQNSCTFDLGYGYSLLVQKLGF